MSPLPTLLVQLGWLLLLALPVACVSWTVTHEEIFREPREWCERRSRYADSLMLRKLCYLATCEYCFSHWVALGFVLLTGFRLLVPGWRGAVVGLFALVWVANLYMSLFALLRQALKHETLEAKKEEHELAEIEEANGGESGDVPGAGEAGSRGPIRLNPPG